MYIKAGIAHAENPKPLLKVSDIRSLPDYKLLVQFNTGETKVFDFSEILSSPAFSQLRDKEVFDSVYVDHGVPVWDGGIDIAPEYLYEHGVLTEGATNF